MKIKEILMNIFLLAVLVRLYYVETTPSLVREVTLIKHAFVPTQFQASKLFDVDVRHSSHLWVHNWIAINSSTIFKTDDWFVNNEIHAELFAMGIADRYRRTIEVFVKTEPLAFESQHSMMILMETMDFFPIGILLNDKGVDVNQQMDASTVREKMNDVRFIVICNL